MADAIMTLTQASVYCQKTLHTTSVARDLPGEYPAIRMMVHAIMKMERDRNEPIPSLVGSVMVEFRKRRIGIETTKEELNRDLKKVSISSQPHTHDV